MVYKMKLSGKVLSNFARGMKNNLRSGLPIVTSLELSKAYCSKKLKADIEGIEQIINEGGTLREAFNNVNNRIPDFFKVMIGIGEESGNLEDVFGFLEEYYMKEYKRRKKIINISIYPIFTLVLSLVMGLIMICRILPKFFSIININREDIPAITKFYMAISDGINSLGVLMVPVSIFLLVLSIFVIRRMVSSRIFFRFAYSTIFIGKLMKQRFESRMSLSLWMMSKSGIDLKTSMYISSESENSFIKERMGDCIRELEKGSMIFEAMKLSGIFSEYLLANVYVGENNGSLEDVFKSVSQVLGEEVDLSMDRLTTLMEPLLIVIVGTFILSIVMAIVMPMLNMYKVKI